MDSSLPDTLKAHKSRKNFLFHPNKKWKGKKTATHMGVRQFQPFLPSLLPCNPRETPFVYLQSGIPFQKQRSGSKNRLRRRRILARNRLYHPRAPLAPRNTTSFIMLSKELGGIAPPVTPYHATPAVIPTPILSPGLRDKGSLEEMNKELGVDGYGSMNGLIRLRPYDVRVRDVSESESDVDQLELLNGDPLVHSVERVEQRIDQGLSRFEIIYPSRTSEVGVPKNLLENCVNSQERLITHLEEENLTLKERLFLVEQEVSELRQRVSQLEGLIRPNELLDEHCEESCGDASAPCN